MCRSIKTLRPPYVDITTQDDVHAAALQYVRKVSGFRAPSAKNAQAFEAAVAEVAAATQHLLDSLQLPRSAHHPAVGGLDPRLPVQHGSTAVPAEAGNSPLTRPVIAANN